MGTDRYILLNKMIEAKAAEIEKERDQIKQAEGLCHMLYQCDKCGKQESIWNSRPRVTPFTIDCAVEGCGGNMRHINWELDRYDPNYQPKKGERIFVDLLPEAVEKYRRAYIEKYWDSGEFPMKERVDLWASKEDALQHFLDAWEFGEPDIITI